ncbi:hypothetical protein [Pendulispora albinea]|uniref:Uncharacterized protein n=1 Tax=Pendulispora albinea TaxID=2741071 RepID=A0ABZ2MCY8_9BACT
MAGRQRRGAFGGGVMAPAVREQAPGRPASGARAAAPRPVASRQTAARQTAPRRAAPRRAAGSPAEVVEAVLPGPYRSQPSHHAVLPSEATRALVGAQVDALLHASPAFLKLDLPLRAELRRDLGHVASYAAELVRDDFYHALQIGQRPMLRVREHEMGPIEPTAQTRQTAQNGPTGQTGPTKRAGTAGVVKQAAFEPSAANNIGRVTRETLQALSFPTFVADLIRGTFNAVVNASIQQMEAFGQLLANVAKTVDQFMADNISDNQARDWLAATYPEHITVRRSGDTAVAAPREGSDERPPPNFQGELGLAEVSLDEDSIESTLVPAARRRLAQTRHRMLATMVLMGLQRIVVTGGRIKATMGFHIDTTDRLAEQHATDLDVRVAASGSFGFGPWSASLSTSVAYVTSNRSQQTNEMNVDADLTSEVELRFKSDYFPLERFVDRQGIQRIQSATAVPEENTSVTGNPAPPSDGPAATAPAAAVGYRSPRSRRTAAAPPPPQRPLGELPPPPAPPTAPTPPTRPSPQTAPPASPSPAPATASPSPSPSPSPTPAPHPTPHPIPTLTPHPRTPPHEPPMNKPEVLPGPFGGPPDPNGIRPSPAVMSLVRAQVKDMLLAAPSFSKLSPPEQRALAHNLVKVSSYNAALLRDQFAQAKKLDQVPVLRISGAPAAPTASAAATKATASRQPPPPPPPSDEFHTRAAGAGATITKDTLNAIQFPVFVADLIKGTFNAVVDASIQQMEAYGKLLANVAKTVDQFMADNITDNQARDYLAQSFPEHFQLDLQGEGGPRVKARDTDVARPDFQRMLGMPENAALDDDSAESKFVPAARRRLAESRLQMLSTMMLMGINRIVITSGTIAAKMGFHLQAKDTGQSGSATEFDFHHENQTGFGGGLGSLFGGPRASQRTSIAYVSTTKKNSTDEIQVNTDLTAEVNLKFKSDYFPLERFAQTGVIAQIQQNTANPVANAPAGQSTAGPGGSKGAQA